MSVTKTENAILVIDMVNDFVAEGAAMRVAGAAATVPAIAKFLEYGRARKWTIIYVNRSHHASGVDAEISRRDLFARGAPFCVPGTKGWETVEELKPQAGDLVVYKQRFSAFFATPLDLILRGLGVKRVFIAGTQYPNCVRASAVDSLCLDYETVVCVDCCSAATPEVAAANVYDLRNMGIACVPSTEIMGG